MNHHDDMTPLHTSTTNRNPSTTLLNLAKDGIMFAKEPAMVMGFGIAQTCVNIGFFLPRKLLPPLGI
jgi:hypothetical protein